MTIPNGSWHPCSRIYYYAIATQYHKKSIDLSLKYLLSGMHHAATSMYIVLYRQVHKADAIDDQNSFAQKLS